jgi:hypothetical protein
MTKVIAGRMDADIPGAIKAAVSSRININGVSPPPGRRGAADNPDIPASRTNKTRKSFFTSFSLK